MKILSPFVVSRSNKSDISDFEEVQKLLNQIRTGDKNKKKVLALSKIKPCIESMCKSVKDVKDAKMQRTGIPSLASSLTGQLHKAHEQLGSVVKSLRKSESTYTLYHQDEPCTETQMCTTYAGAVKALGKYM